MPPIYAAARSPTTPRAIAAGLDGPLVLCTAGGRATHLNVYFLDDAPWVTAFTPDLNAGSYQRHGFSWMEAIMVLMGAAFALGIAISGVGLIRGAAAAEQGPAAMPQTLINRKESVHSETDREQLKRYFPQNWRDPMRR